MNNNNFAALGLFLIFCGASSASPTFPVVNPGGNITGFNGITWSAPLADGTGNLLELNYQDASTACSALGHLPSRDEYKSAPSDVGKIANAPYAVFWTSTVYEIDPQGKIEMLVYLPWVADFNVLATYQPTHVICIIDGV
jgi:hypothetical protein